MAKKTKPKRESMTSEERKVSILRKVTSVFARKGFAGTRTADLAKAAGVSQALIYKLFGDKEGLYTAMIHHKLVEVQQGALSVKPPPTGDDQAFFTEIAKLILGRTREDPEFPRLLLHSELEGNSFSQLFRQMHSHGAIAHLSSYIEERIAAGGMIDIDPKLAAWSFLGMVWQFALSAYVFKEPLTPPGSEEEIAAGFVRIFLKGVQRTPD